MNLKMLPCNDPVGVSSVSGGRELGVTGSGLLLSSKVASSSKTGFARVASFGFRSGAASSSHVFKNNLFTVQIYSQHVTNQHSKGTQVPQPHPYQLPPPDYMFFTNLSHNSQSRKIYEKGMSHQYSYLPTGPNHQP